MTIFFNINNFEILEFYSYPTTIVHRMVEYDEGFHKNSPDNVEDVKDFFEDVLKYAENKLGKSLMDNKVAFKILYKPTNTIMYVGYKDWNWTIGLGLNKYMIGNVTKIK